MTHCRFAGIVAVCALLVAGRPAAADVFTNVPEAASYKLVYTLPIPNTAGWNTNAIPYSVNNAASVTYPFDRVAYYMELDSGSGLKYAYASMDAFTPSAPHLGVPSRPSGGNFQQIVKNMNVASNVTGVTNGTKIATGNIEFWPNNYEKNNTGQNSGFPAAISVPGASDAAYDWGDRQSNGNYGSMQIHNHGTSPNPAHTVMAYNNWGGGNGEAGIGNRPSGEKDWTFSNNIASYSVKNLQVLVHQVAAQVPEAAGYSLAYKLDLPNAATYNASGVPYSINNTSFIRQPYDRVAYYMELQKAGETSPTYAWVSMDAFTRDISQIGVPARGTGANFQQLVTNMNVQSNKAGVVNATGIATGNIEFWPSNYDAANSGQRPGYPPALPIPNSSGSVYDSGDRQSSGDYGSMQIHNHATGSAHTVMAVNHWGNNAGGKLDIGIGNAGGSNTDWTFSNNSDQYTLKSLYVLVHQDPTPGVFRNVPEAADYTLVHALAVPNNANNMDANGVPYSVNNAASITRPIDRIAYYIELQGATGDLQYAYVSMDAFTQDASKIGLPVSGNGAFFQQRVGHMNVVSNKGGIVTGSGLTSGNIEFWPNNYGKENTTGVPGANASGYDFGDRVDAGATVGYGSMQVHNYGGKQTVLAYNAWGNSGRVGDIGIGNNSGSDTDWTFASNVGSYRVKNIYTLVHEADAALLPDPSLERRVFQRHDDRGTVKLNGQYAGPVTRIEARAVPVAGYAGTATDWTVIDSSLSGGSFAGAMQLAPGWYSVEMRAFNGATQVAANAIDRIGVGEIFITAGQSNSANSGQTRQTASNEASLMYTHLGWERAADPQPFATATGGSPWPDLGDLLVDQHGVPVGFYAVGVGGTRLDQWVPGSSTHYYDRIQAAIQNLGGDFAGILWHQGESDASAGTSTADYIARLEQLIALSRLDADWDVPWGVALVSYLPGNSAANMARIIAAQRAVIEADPLVFQGPYTDLYIGSQWRYDNVHFNDAGLRLHAQLWMEAANSIMSVPEPISVATMLLAGASVGGYLRRRRRCA